MNNNDNLQHNNQIILDSIQKLINDCTNKIEKLNDLKNMTLNEKSKTIIEEEINKVNEIKDNLEAKLEEYKNINRENERINSKICQTANGIIDGLKSKNNNKEIIINREIADENKNNYINGKTEKLEERLEKLDKKRGTIESRQRKIRNNNEKIEISKKDKEDIKDTKKSFKEQKAYGPVARAYYEELKTNLRLMGLKAKGGIIKGPIKIGEKKDDIISKTPNKDKEKINIFISRLKSLTTATFKGFNAFKTEI